MNGRVRASRHPGGGHGTLWTGAVLVGLVVLMALASVVWTPYDPTRVRPDQTLFRPGWPHVLGTDGFGIDIFSRLLVGARSCLLVGVVAVLIGALFGVPLGIWAGMRRGLVGRVILRATDIMYAFPALLLAILLAAARGSGSTLTAMVAIGLASVPAFTRVARASTLGVVDQDYVTAARSAGIGWQAVARRHVLINIAPMVLVQASASFALAILAEAALSYLGLGTPPTVPTWGRMLYDAQKYLFMDPLQTLWPGLAIAVAVLGFNLLGDGLRELLDPRLRESA